MQQVSSVSMHLSFVFVFHLMQEEKTASRVKLTRGLVGMPWISLALRFLLAQSSAGLSRVLYVLVASRVYTAVYLVQERRLVFRPLQVKAFFSLWVFFLDIPMCGRAVLACFGDVLPRGICHVPLEGYKDDQSDSSRSGAGGDSIIPWFCALPLACFFAVEENPHWVIICRFLSLFGLVIGMEEWTFAALEEMVNTTVSRVFLVASPRG